MEQFIIKANELYNNKYDYSKVNYINSKTKVKIMCNIHGEFEQTPLRHYKSGCQKCKPKRIYKHNTNTFIEKSKEIHGNKYDYSQVDYVNNKTKVKIICKIHGIFEIRPDDHFQKVGCINCTTRNTDNNGELFIKRAIEVHGNKYNYSKVKYSNTHENVIIICSIHGEFEQLPCNHLEGSNCPSCAINNKTLEKRKGNDIKFFMKANEMHDNKYDYSKSVYINKFEPIIIICNIHGEFIQRPMHHLNSNGCYNCGMDNLKVQRKEEYSKKFIEYSKEIHGDKYDYSKVIYENNNSKVIITCSKHGDFFQIPNSHIAGSGCYKCSKTNFSKKQIQWLEYIMKKENIFIQHALNIGEFTIDKYKIDGYCKETNTCYEFNGSYYHGEPRLYDDNVVNNLVNKTMKELYDDTIKRENYIKSKNFNLVVMWELDWDKFVKKK